MIPEQLLNLTLASKAEAPNRAAERMNDDRVNWRIIRHPSSGDPNERAHPVVNKLIDVRPRESGACNKNSILYRFDIIMISVTLGQEDCLLSRCLKYPMSGSR